MDIQYLLLLQDYRNSIQDALTPLMEFITIFAVDYLILIPIFFYWFQDKRKGLYPLVSYYFCMFLTPVIKLSACIYRPWIRDARILPAGDSIRTATGYSFPSGHTSTAVPLAGGMAVNLWDSRKTRWLSALFVLFFLLTGFSRNYLGVHTPQDVFVAIFLSVLSLICTAKLMAYLDRHPEREDWFLLGGFLLAWAGNPVYLPESLSHTSGQQWQGPGGSRENDERWLRGSGKGHGVHGGPLRGKEVGPVPAPEKGAAKPAPLPGRADSGGAAERPGAAILTGALGNHWGKLIFSVIHVFWFITLYPLILKLLGRAMQLDPPEALKS